MDLEVMLEIANLLEDSSSQNDINMLGKILNDNKFALTVWGHFSSGKSYLINNIIGRNILPVRKTETTAVLTYIMYGHKEEVRVIKTDGNVTIADISELKNIYQDDCREEELECIDHIEVEIECDFLERGLIIVDTPGVNTLVKRHQELAFRAIDQSGQIVYVLGGSPTNVDRDFIQKIVASGVDITFVRTNCDRINAEEENIPETFSKEKNVLRNIIGKEPNVIYVSNIESSEWFQNISELKKIVKKLSENLEKEIEKAVNRRLGVISESLLKKLQDEKEYLHKVHRGDIEDIKTKIEECNERIKKLESLAKDQEQKLYKKVECTNSDIKNNLNSIISSQSTKFNSEIDEIDLTGNLECLIKEKFREHVEKSIEFVQAFCNREYAKIIGEEEQLVSDSVGTDFYDVNVPTLSEVCVDNSYEVDYYRGMLTDVKNELDKIVGERESNEEQVKKQQLQLTNDENEYLKKLNDLEEILKGISDDIPMICVKEENCVPSYILKRIGQAVDLALLLLPGDTIAGAVKGAINSKKVAEVLQKSGKIGKIVTDIAGVTEKSANTIDKAKDFLYSVNRLRKSDNRRLRINPKSQREADALIDKTAEKVALAYDGYVDIKRKGKDSEEYAEKASIFDKLEVAYWTEKLGRKFDTPPKYEVDYDELESRNQLKKKITAEETLIIEEKIRKQKEIGMLIDKQQELDYKKKELNARQKRIEEEIQRQEKNAAMEAKKKSILQFKNSYKEYYHSCLSEIMDKISASYKEKAYNNFQMYFETNNRSLLENIEHEKEHMENLIALGNGEEDEVKEKLDKCQYYISILEGFTACK